MQEFFVCDQILPCTVPIRVPVGGTDANYSSNHMSHFIFEAVGVSIDLKHRPPIGQRWGINDLDREQNRYCPYSARGGSVR